MPAELVLVLVVFAQSRLKLIRLQVLLRRGLHRSDLELVGALVPILVVRPALVGGRVVFWPVVVLFARVVACRHAAELPEAVVVVGRGLLVDRLPPVGLCGRRAGVLVLPGRKVVHRRHRHVRHVQLGVVVLQIRVGLGRQVVSVGRLHLVVAWRQVVPWREVLLGRRHVVCGGMQHHSRVGVPGGVDLLSHFVVLALVVSLVELLERVQLFHGEHRDPPVLVAHVNHLHVLLAAFLATVDGLVRNEYRARHQVLGVGRGVVADRVEVVMVVVVVQVVLVVPVVHLVVPHDAHVDAAVEAAEPAARAVQVRHPRAPALVHRALGRTVGLRLPPGTGGVLLRRSAAVGRRRRGPGRVAGRGRGVRGGAPDRLLGRPVDVVRRQAAVDAPVEAAESAQRAIQVAHSGTPAGVVLVVLAYLVRLVADLWARLEVSLRQGRDGVCLQLLLVGRHWRRLLFL